VVKRKCIEAPFPVFENEASNEKVSSTPSIREVEKEG